MRIATITAKTKAGQWVTLAQPDVPIHEQKAYMKQLKAEGGVVQIGGKAVELEAVEMFVSGSGKRMRFKPEVPVASEEPGAVKNLEQLAEALGMEKAELDVIRKLDGFPSEKLEDGSYDVEAIKAFLNPSATELAVGLDALGAALGLTSEEMAGIAILDGFPDGVGTVPEEDEEHAGKPLYDINAVGAFIAELATREE